MTEDEAKQKWCPMVRLAGGEDWIGSYNSDPQTPYNQNQLSRCIASDCMMWRWKEDTTRSVTRKGYCGLGGKP